MHLRLEIFIMGIASLLNIFMPVSMAASINPNCDFYQDLMVGQEYYIYNTEYPRNYPAGTSCRWSAGSAAGTNIVVSCEDINIPNSANCQGDKLAISLTGDEDLNDARTYCGKGNLTLVTESNRLSVGLFATNNSPGGRFVCTLTAFNSGPPPTTTDAPNVCNCGWKQGTRIIGGHETGINEYPAMAAIINIDNEDLFCGATIIATRYALTAAHCLLNHVPRDFGLLVGDHNISTGADTAAAALYALEKFITHPLYNSTGQRNDIAIIRTNLTMVFSIFVGPICLPFRYTYDDFVGQEVTALGWGFLDFAGPKSDVLQGVELNVISNQECDANMPEVVTYNQVCTYAPGKDACLSDSGGPLFYLDRNTNRLQMVGIISYGLGCATSKPGVNTRVSAYLSWILSSTPDAHYCIK